MDYFAMIEREIFKMNEKYSEKIQEDCCHDNIFVDGFETCKKCGLVQNCSFDFSDDFHGENSRLSTHYRPYLKKKHVKDVLRRLTMYFYKETKKVNIQDVPNEIRDIRRFIRVNKLKQKNDIHYWRTRNNVNEYISQELLLSWSDAFVKQKQLKAKDFVFEKLKENNFLKLAKLFERKGKKQKDVNQTQ